MKQGFTLLELSIVLVIIGLIIGGITVGQDLIRSAEINQTVSNFQKFQTAVNSFKLKYNAIPGDMNNAQDYWGVAHATPATCVTTASTGTETCNGDGDGIIDDSTGSKERFRFWQHLANAEIISGSFTGVGGSGGANQAVADENVPAGTISGTAWHSNNLNTPGTAELYEMDYGNYLLIGLETSNAGPNGAAFSPVDAQRMDQKVDDGEPARGMVIARYWDDACAAADDGGSADNDYDASYVLSDTTQQCALYFRKLW